MVQKGDIYYLKDSKGCQIAKFEVTDDPIYSSVSDTPCSVVGNCYTALGWTMDPKTGKYTLADDWEFFVKGYFKWDSCTHWYYCGEDYSPDGYGDKDGYYHICGPEILVEHMRAKCFVWKLMGDIMTDNCDGYYTENEKLNQIIETMLDGYSIVKEEV